MHFVRLVKLEYLPEENINIGNIIEFGILIYFAI